MEDMEPCEAPLDLTPDDLSRAYALSGIGWPIDGDATTLALDALARYRAGKL